MSIKSKDAMYGGAAAVAIVGVIVYTEYRHGKLKAEIEELRKETQTLANYIRLLEAKVASDLKTVSEGGHSHHHVRTHNPTPIISDASNSTPVSETNGHRHHVHQNPPINNPLNNSHKPKHSNSDKKPKIEVVDEEEPIVEQKSSERKPRDPIPPRKEPKPRPTRVEQRTPPPSQSSRRPPAPTSEKKKKVFMATNEDDDEEAFVNMAKSGPVSGPKSILRNGKSPNKPEEKEPEPEDDDLLADIEGEAKKTEGREEPVNAHKARAQKTREMAEAMRKKREEREASLKASSRVPNFNNQEE